MIEVRHTSADELRAAAEVVTTALLAPLPTDERWARRTASWQTMPSLAAWDGDRCVGHAGHFPVDTVVPGGALLPTAAVTRVAVLPTHTRRGVATRLMKQLVSDSVESGHVLMSLRASETGIYGRYGFGCAGDSSNLEIEVAGAAPLRGVDRSGSFTILGPDELLDAVPPLYAAVALRRPGAITRPAESWWLRLLEPLLERSSAGWVVVHVNAAGQADGYVHYTAGWNDDSPDEAPTGRGEVVDLFGVDDPVELALWQYVLDVDLVTRWRANGRPVDDPVRLAAADGRAVRVRAVEDEQWIRLVDVDAALTARTYGDARGAVVIGITDPLVERNNDTWQVDADGARRTAEPADLTVDVATLSACYLGGRSWRPLAALGDVDVTDPGALDTADALFGTGPAPWCGTFF